jgi:hypothetical protein
MPDIFSPEAFQRAVHASIGDAFQAIPHGKRGALLIVADERGTELMLAAKLGDHWQLAAGGGKTWDGSIQGKIAIAGSW